MLKIRMAWRNLWRNRRRTMLTVSAVGMGLAILITLISFSTGMLEMMVEQISRSSLGHIQVHRNGYLEQKSSSLIIPDGTAITTAIESIPGVKATSPRLLFSGTVRSSRSSSIQVVSVTAVDPDREKTLSAIPEKTVNGGFLAVPEGSGDPEAPARIRLRKGITIGSRLAQLLKVEIGSRIRLDTAGLKGSTTSAAFYVTGIVKTGTDAIDRGQVWVRLADMQEITAAGDALHEIAVVTESPSTIEPVVAAIEAIVDGKDLSVSPWWEIAPEIRQTIEMSSSWTGVLDFLMLIILSAGILTTMYMIVFERRREYGVRLALGESPGGLFRGLVLEALMISTLACLTGLTTGAVLVAFLVNVGVDLSWLVGGYDFGGLYIENIYRGSAAFRVFAEPAAVVFIGTVLIALWPALRVARMRAVDAIKEG